MASLCIAKAGGLGIGASLAQNSAKYLFCIFLQPLRFNSPERELFTTRCAVAPTEKARYGFCQ